MADTSWEEARRCPKCTDPGRSSDPTPTGERDGSTYVVMTCGNPRCKWYEQSWTIRVRADGTIPPAVTQREKTFVTRPNAPSAEDWERVISKQVAQETKPGGGEITRRR